MRRDERARREAVRRERAARVEAEPADPQQARADEAQNEAVRRHRLLRVPGALPEIDRAHERRHARRDVDDRAAGEIERREAAAERGVQQAALSPHHVRERRVHAQRPQRHEDDGAAKRHALGRRAGDQRRRDDREHQLIHHEGELRDRRAVVGVRLDADAPHDGRPLAEAQAVADDGPEARDERHEPEALDHDRERVLLPHEPAVEEREPGPRHHQHERGAHEHPRVVGRGLRGGDALIELREIGLHRGGGRRRGGRLRAQAGGREHHAQQREAGGRFHMSLRSPVRMR